MEAEIIIFDPLISIRKDFINIMSKHRINVIEAANSFELFNQLSMNNVKLIVMEIALSKENGFEVISRIRNNLKFKDIPIIILSGRASKKDLFRGMASGAVDYIAKPYTEEFMASRILKFVKPKNTELPETFYSNNFELNFQQFIELQFEMCIKGSYPLCFLMSNISQKDVKYSKENEKFYFNIIAKTQKELKKVLRGTDYVFTFGSKNLITIAPFCPIEYGELLAEKINTTFILKVADKENIPSMSINTEYARYPEDGKTKDQIINNLLSKIDAKLKLSNV
jgi:PleD family two-component response regulator